MRNGYRTGGPRKGKKGMDKVKAYYSHAEKCCMK